MNKAKAIKSVALFQEPVTEGSLFEKEKEEEDEGEVKDKEERETEVVMEEGEVVMEVKQVMVAEAEVGGGKGSCQGEGGHLDIRDKIIGAIQGMGDGLPQLDERLAELERYVEEEHSEAECKTRVAEVLTDSSSFASPISALVGVLEGSLELCEGRGVKLKEWARGECKPICILIKGEVREAKMLITMSFQC